MFNGIIFNKGIVKKIQKRPKGINIFLKSDVILKKKDMEKYIRNTPINVNGVRNKRKING